MYQETSKPQTLAASKMIQAFGVPLLNTDGGARNDQWGKYWERVIRLRGKHYRLPGGALGRKFTSMYSEEVKCFGKRRKKVGSLCLFHSFDASKRQKHQDHKRCSKIDTAKNGNVATEKIRLVTS